MRKINARGLRLVKDFEGCELTAYLCPAKIWTVGYGSTGPHVKPGMKISQGEADELLLEDLERFEAGVEKLVAGVPTNDDQFSAFVCLSFNIGLSAFAGSTVLKRHKLGNYVGAAKAFEMWNRGGGRVLQGLVRRRAAEARLYRGM
jgi:lysozyme